MTQPRPAWSLNECRGDPFWTKKGEASMYRTLFRDHFLRFLAPRLGAPDVLPATVVAALRNRRYDTDGSLNDPAQLYMNLLNSEAIEFQAVASAWLRCMTSVLDNNTARPVGDKESVPTGLYIHHTLDSGASSLLFSIDYGVYRFVPPVPGVVGRAPQRTMLYVRARKDAMRYRESAPSFAEGIYAHLDDAIAELQENLAFNNDRQTAADTDRWHKKLNQDLYSFFYILALTFGGNLLLEIRFSDQRETFRRFVESNLQDGFDLEDLYNDCRNMVLLIGPATKFFLVAYHPDEREPIRVVENLKQTSDDAAMEDLPPPLAGAGASQKRAVDDGSDPADAKTWKYVSQ